MAIIKMLGKQHGELLGLQYHWYNHFLTCIHLIPRQVKKRLQKKLPEENVQHKVQHVEREGKRKQTEEAQLPNLCQQILFIKDVAVELER